MNKTVVLYGISALSLLALADYYPRLATLFALLLILGVLAEHGADYAGLLDKGQGK